MKITKATHKAFLYNLFQSGGQPKTFPIDKLMTASSTAKKLTQGGEETKNPDGSGQIKFSVSDVEFTAEEEVLLKELFKQKTTGTIAEAPILEEIKELFQ